MGQVMPMRRQPVKSPAWVGFVKVLLIVGFLLLLYWLLDSMVDHHMFTH